MKLFFNLEIDEARDEKLSQRRLSELQADLDDISDNLMTCNITKPLKDLSEGFSRQSPT